MPGSLASRVVELRDSRGWTDGDVAERSGISRGYVSRIARGEVKRPSARILARLAGALGVPPTDLMEAAGDLSPEQAANAAIRRDRFYVDLSKVPSRRRAGIIRSIEALIESAEREDSGEG